MRKPLALTIGVLLLVAAPVYGQDPGSISGTVAVPDADLLPTVRVFAFASDSTSASGQDSFFGHVEPDGNYRIDGIEPGTYFVMAHGPEYLPQFYDGAESISDATSLEVTPGTHIEGVHFVLARPGAGTSSLRGQVIAASDGSPISNARVTGWNESGAPFQVDARTDAAGAFSIDQVRGGTYHLFASAAGYLPADRIGGASVVSVAEGETAEGIELALERAATISGVVTDSTGEAVAEVMVRAESTTPIHPDSIRIGPDGQILDHQTGAVDVVFSEPDGSFRFDRLRPGSYRIAAQSQPGWWDSALIWYPGVASRAEADSITVAPGDSVTGIDFVVSGGAPVGGIAGFVYRADGSPIARAVIEAMPYSVASGDSSGAGGSTDGCCASYNWAHTGPDGRFEIFDLPEGEYFLSAVIEGAGTRTRIWWPGVRRIDALPVPVFAGEVTEGFDFVFDGPRGASAISGTIIDSAGQTLQGAVVRTVPSRNSAGHAGTYASVRADSSGAFRLVGLEPGDYHITASWWGDNLFGQAWHPSASDQSQAVLVSLPSDSVLVDIDVVIDVRPVFGDISGAVVDASTGVPLSRALVELQWEQRGDVSFASPLPGGYGFAVTGEDGSFLLERIPEGNFLVSASVDGGFSYAGGAYVPELAEPVSVRAGETSFVEVSVEIRRDGPGIIMGSVTADGSVWWADSSATTVDWVAVIEARPTATIALWPDSERRYTGVTLPDGSYVLARLPPGEYIVSARSPHHLPVYYADQYDPALATVVAVTESIPAEGIDFELLPNMYMDAGEGAGRAGSISIHGHVHDPSGAPVSGATVVILDASGNPVASAQTNLDGFYEVTGLPEGDYRVMVSKQGHATTYNGDTPDLDSTSPVAVGGAPTEVDLVLGGANSTAIDDTEPALQPDAFVLHGNYPNPFNPVTTIVFDLPAPAKLSLEVFDLLGRSLVTQSLGTRGIGKAQSIQFDASSLGSGIYLYRLVAIGKVGWNATGRMVVMK